MLNNMLYLAKCTNEYLPALHWGVAFSIALKVLIPVFEMYLPKIIIDGLTGANSLQRLIIIVVSFTLMIAVLGGFAKFCERYVYNKKILMGSYYIHKTVISFTLRFRGKLAQGDLYCTSPRLQDSPSGSEAYLPSLQK